MWATTFPRIRRKMFEVFFYAHHLYILFMVFFVFHVGISYASIMLPGFYLFMIDRFLRFLQSKGNVRLISSRVLPCETLELNFSKSQGLSFTPTSIIFVNVPSISKAQWHPFTISSSSNLEPEKLSIMIKGEGSWSKKLYQILSSPNPVEQLDVCVEGPYGPISTNFLRHDMLVMVSGGSGITPFISIFRELVYTNETLKCKAPKILLISAFKDSSDLTMLELLLPSSGAPIEFTKLDLQIEAVGFWWNKKKTAMDSKQIQSMEGATPVNSPNSWFYNADRELESVPQQSLLQSTNVHYGERPDLKRMLFEQKESSVGVLVCGPKKMRHEVANICSSGLASNLHFESISFSWADPLLQDYNKLNQLDQKDQKDTQVHDQNQREVADSNRLQSTLEEEEEHESIEGTNVSIKRNWWTVYVVDFRKCDNQNRRKKLLTFTRKAWNKRSIALRFCDSLLTRHKKGKDTRRLGMLFEQKESSVGVLVCGPKKMRHEVANICSSGLASNLHFESISFSWLTQTDEEAVKESEKEYIGMVKILLTRGAQRLEAGQGQENRLWSGIAEGLLDKGTRLLQNLERQMEEDNLRRTRGELEEEQRRKQLGEGEIVGINCITRNIGSLSVRKRNRGPECGFVNTSAICKADETNAATKKPQPAPTKPKEKKRKQGKETTEATPPAKRTKAGKETDIQEQDKKKAKNKQSRARNGKDKVKPKPKSKVNQMKKIQLEGLKLPNLKLYYKKPRAEIEISGKRISDKRTKNQAKTDKTEHGMEKHEKDKVKSKPKSTPTKSKPRSFSNPRYLHHLNAMTRIFSDYSRANHDRKSTIGGCQFLGRRLISWQCKKQTIVATSTTEAEYVAAANCCGQVLWIQNQMLDYVFNFMNIKFYIDNESTIYIVKNPVFHSKTKHIEIRQHFIRDAYEKKLIQLLLLEVVGTADTKVYTASVAYYHHTTNGHQFTMSNRHQELASSEQTTSSKDFSNLLIVDSLLKTIWFINASCFCNESLAIPGQTATGKELSNPLMAGSLPKTTLPPKLLE
ncbi:ferric reduction oxidase 2 [Tanacetum coccineum]